VDLDLAAREISRGELPGDIGGALAHEVRLRAEGRGPRGDVRRLPPGADLRLGARLAFRVGLDGPVGPDDHVQQQVAERAHMHA